MSLGSLLYSGCVSFLLTHELDAMTQREWRLLYVLRSLPEQTARSAFVALHVPLTAGLLWTLDPANTAAQMAVAAFSVIHSCLHIRFRLNSWCTFTSTLSKSLIHGAGLCGLAFLFNQAL